VDLNSALGLARKSHAIRYVLIQTLNETDYLGRRFTSVRSQPENLQVWWVKYFDTVTVRKHQVGVRTPGVLGFCGIGNCGLATEWGIITPV